VAGFLATPLWIHLGEAVTDFLDGDLMGWAYLAFGIATFLFWRSRLFWPIVSKFTSASFRLPAALSASLGMATMLIVLALQYAVDIPFVFYGAAETPVFILAAMGSLIAVCALVANAWVYLQDRKRG
jgi:hypothetical protein